MVEGSNPASGTLAGDFDYTEAMFTSIRPSIPCCLLAILWLMFRGMAVHAMPLSVGERPDRFVGGFASFLEDASRSLTLRDLQAGHHVWTPLEADSMTPGFSRAVWWMRIPLYNDTANTQHLLLDTGTVLVDFLDLYSVRGSGQIEHVQTGDRRPFATRPLHTRSLVFPLTLEPGETLWLYLRMDSFDGLHEVVSPRVTNPQDFAERLQGETLALGLYFGTMGAVLLYNLFLYISTREHGFRIYLLYVAAFFFWSFAFRGYGFQYWWPESPVLNNQILPIGAALCYCTFGLFVMEYLCVKRDAPRWLYLANWIAILANAFTLLPPLLGFYALSFAVSVPVGVVMMFFAVFTGVVLMRRGSRPARYFLLAFSLLAVGVALYYVQMLGWVSAGPVTEYGVQIGSGLEALLLAFGLADQMNALKADKLKAEQDARAAQLALNTELAREVQQRTQELQQANQRLIELSITDELTGVFNRRHFNQLFESAFASHLRYQTPLALCMIDIDYFKAYNDTYGHQAGDEVLRKVSHCLRSSLRRSNDRLFRLGGEEFAILLSVDDSPAKCMPFVDQMRRAIEALAIPHGGNPAGVVTASFGLLTLTRPSTLQRASDVYARADQLLYQAKASGRNRVVHESC